jgi:hypothetical protein
MAQKEALAENSWTKAAIIGTFAGVPTAFFMQIGFVKTLAARKEPLKRSRHWLFPPGIGYAALRDILYSVATQKQVQNAQSGKSSFSEDVALNAAIVLAPLFFDTLSIKTVKPNFVVPKNPFALLKATCPPEAILGRFMWAPLYNWVYVSVQSSIGDENRSTELLGLVVGSVAASYVAFPCFMFKTNLLISKAPEATSASSNPVVAAVSRFSALFRAAFIQTVGSKNLDKMPSVSEAVNPSRLFKGAVPHMWGNVGPDVLCMAIGRLAFAQLVAMGVLSTVFSGGEQHMDEDS